MRIFGLVVIRFSPALRCKDNRTLRQVRTYERIERRPHFSLVPVARLDAMESVDRVAITVFGWGAGGLLGGILADYIGRKRSMTLTILA